MTAGFAHFALRRQSDDLIYLFDRQPLGTAHGYRRRDADLWITWQAGFGWGAWDAESGDLQGRPWDMDLDGQTEDHPPEGVWVSRKGAKSYVYVLGYVDVEP
jgi:hypothetical protein